jgi:lipocalin
LSAKCLLWEGEEKFEVKNEEILKENLLRCSNKYKPMKDFQKLKFMGKWYEVERFYTMRDLIATCISVTYDRFDDGKIYVTNQYTNRL